MSTSDSHPSARSIAGRFVVGARRGTGLEAATFEAIDQETGHPVMLRVVHPTLSADGKFQDRFRTEMRGIEQLVSPHLAQVVQWGSDFWNGRPVLYVASEHLGGGSLRDLLDRGRLLSPSQALMVGLDTCKALDVLHRAGHTHSDIRPATLMFGADSRLRVVDAGLSLVIGEHVWADGSQPRQELAMFASPERATGEPIGPPTDIYSLALTMIEAATGRVPFVGDSAVATLAHRVDRLLPVNADLGPLAAILERAARPQADERFNAAGFGAALLKAAPRLPRPAPLPTLSGGLFAERSHNVDDPTFPTPRPTEAAGVAERDEASPAEATVAVSDAVVDAGEPIVTDPPVTDESSHEVPGMRTPVTASAMPAAEHATVPATEHSTVPATEPAPVPAAAQQSVEGAVEPVTDDVAEHIPPPDPVFDVPDAPLEPMPELSHVAVPEPDDTAADASTGMSPATPEPATNPATNPATAARRTAPQPIRPKRKDAATAASPATPATTTQAPSRGYDIPARRSGGRWWWVIGIVGVLALAAGAVGWYVATRPEEYPMPVLANRTVALATAELDNLKVKYRTVDVPDEEVPTGSIISTDPPSGVTITEGDTVTLNVSAGPAPRRIPDLLGADAGQARARLIEAGLVVTRADDVFDENVPEGSIVSFRVPDQPTIKAGDTVARGTTLELTVSKGPRPRQTPRVTNLPVADATAVLQQLGLNLQVTGDAFDIIVPVGQIVSQTPEPNTEIARGGTVQVVTSRGPEMGVVPAVVGMNFVQISESLKAAGFKVGATTGDVFSALRSMTVGGRNVVPGQQIPKGSTIDLNFAV